MKYCILTGRLHSLNPQNPILQLRESRKVKVISAFGSQCSGNLCFLHFHIDFSYMYMNEYNILSHSPISRRIYYTSLFSL